MNTDLESSDEPVEPVYRKYRVWLRSVPGMYTQYDGYVDLLSPSSDREELFTRAVRELSRTSFPDRKSREFWLYDRAEEVK